MAVTTDPKRRVTEYPVKVLVRRLNRQTFRPFGLFDAAAAPQMVKQLRAVGWKVRYHRVDEWTDVIHEQPIKVPRCPSCGMVSGAHCSDAYHSIKEPPLR